MGNVSTSVKAAFDKEFTEMEVKYAAYNAAVGKESAEMFAKHAAYKAAVGNEFQEVVLSKISSADLDLMTIALSYIKPSLFNKFIIGCHDESYLIEFMEDFIKIAKEGYIVFECEDAILDAKEAHDIEPDSTKDARASCKRLFKEMATSPMFVASVSNMRVAYDEIFV